MRTRMFLRYVAVAGALAGAGALTVHGQAPATQVPPVVVDSLTGRDAFTRYCAPCHGPAGLGNGPVAPALTTRPADLTALTRRYGGGYPREIVREVLTSGTHLIPAHGTLDMPVWGPLFRAVESNARAAVRIENLVAYLESLQPPSALPQDAGGQLFRTHCASCHGADARGSGPLADQLRRMPPDLTTFTHRNGGVFPGERVRRIIDGRDVASHGDREMPVWGDVFRIPRGAGGTSPAAGRIDAIVRYLEGIQQRGTH